MAGTNLNERNMQYEEIIAKSTSGMAVLLLNIIMIIVALAGFIYGTVILDSGKNVAPGIALMVVGGLYSFIIGPTLFAGLKILKPNEALVLTLFGKYYGTLKGAGFFFVNPFVSAVNPAAATPTSSGTIVDEKAAVFVKGTPQALMAARVDKKISLKTMTLNNDKQKK